VIELLYEKTKMMKIKSVEIPCDEYHDGTESTGSDTFDSSGNQLPFSNSESNHEGVGASRSDTTIAQYEKTMGTLAAAISELHRDLRDKTNECEALYETAHSLSRALQESDRLLQNKTLECERLLLKLQMVTFCELNDDIDPLGFSYDESLDVDKNDCYENDAYFAIPTRPAAILDKLAPFLHSGGGAARTTYALKPKPESMKERVPKKSSSTRVIGSNISANGKGKSGNAIGELVTFIDATGVCEGGEGQGRRGTSVSGPVCVDDCDEYYDTDCVKNDNIIRKTRAPRSHPVCVDGDMESEYERQSRTTFKQDDESLRLAVGPSQAHFYHVILERDMAKQTNLKLTRDLRSALSQVRDLKSKFDHSKTLLELTYSSITDTSNSGMQQKSEISVSRKPKEVSNSNVAEVGSMKTSTYEPTAGSTTTGIRRGSLPWRRNHGIGSTSGLYQDKQSLLNVTDYVSFILEDEMLSKNWNKTSDKAADAAATEEYLKVLYSADDDADRAGGVKAPVLVDV
jgi:hypothetical protein